MLASCRPIPRSITGVSFQPLGKISKVYDVAM